ncbi:MAG: hypothetical protein KKD07_06925, partial [Candidatus Omnitrophica bacterium]|nr:hypothetical protein [Candidatus Omnitrophota bacterium]
SRLLGVIGGISNNGSAQAGLLAFYIRPDDVGFRAGYLMSNDLSGNFYNDLGMFELDGSLNYYQDFPTMYSPEDLESALDDNIEIYGDIVGGSGFYGGLSLDATNIKDQNWGLFYGGAGGSLITPLGDGWQISMNGVGFEPDSNIIDSYIMGQMTGDGWSNNEFSGIFSGQYISINSLGIFSGDILGVYDQSQESWEALMLGSSSEIEQLTSSGGLMATVRDHDMNADLLEGLIGLRDNIWDGGASFVSMGKAEFWVRGTDDFIWYGAPQSFYSYDPYGDDGSGRYSTFEDEQNDNQYGSLVGLSVGRTNDGFMEGILYSIYVDPEGNFGVASDNNLLGMYDNETEMYLLEGYLGLSTPKSGYPLAPEDLYTNLSFSDVTGNPEVGGFTIGGDINLEEFSSSLVSLYNLDWGIFELHGAGTYADNISDSWTVDGMTGMTSEVDTYRLGGSWLGSMAGSIWSENRIDGQLDAVWIQLRRDGTLSGHTITASEVLGNYVEIESESGTFQVASAGEWVEVDSLLDLAGQYDDITNLAGPNIPITEVYTSLLSGSGMFESGGSLNIVSMNMDFYVNDDFYNFISNGIWAAKIDGTFTNPVGMAWTANVTGNLRNTMTEGIDGTVSATFSGTDFDNGHWQADVIGSTSTDITFQGVAGGTIDSGLLTFTGAGTGTYQTP